MLRRRTVMRWEYHVVHLGRIAVALIVDDQDRALMSWRYRFVTDQWGFELLGGMVDAGEDAAGTAAREAEEESGWRPVEAPYLTTVTADNRCCSDAAPPAGFEPALPPPEAGLPHPLWRL
jgi:8-oxo-dGTP pyrophosphatase MutT (NUDIX family)